MNDLLKKKKNSLFIFVILILQFFFLLKRNAEKFFSKSMTILVPILESSAGLNFISIGAKIIRCLLSLKNFGFLNRLLSLIILTTEIILFFHRCIVYFAMKNTTT